MKKLILSLLAVVLAAGVVLSTGVAAAPPWADNRDDAPRGRGQLRPPGGPMRLGMMVATLTPKIAEKLGVEHQEGLVVVRVVPESQAAGAGLERGDIITAVNGSPVANPGDLKGIVKEAEGMVTLSVVGKGDITLDLSQAFPSGEPREPRKPHPRPKPHPGFWLLRLLGPELEGIPAGERYSHFMGLELRVTDNEGVPHTLAIIPGTVASVSGDTLTLLTNEGSEVTYTITEDVKGHQLMERLEEGRKLIVATVDGEVRAIFPPHLLLGGPHRPGPRPLSGVEGTAEG